MLAWVGQIITLELAEAAAQVSIPAAARLAARLATNLGLIVRATAGNVGFAADTGGVHGVAEGERSLRAGCPQGCFLS